jgi:hypothetical protein
MYVLAPLSVAVCASALLVYGCSSPAADGGDGLAGASALAGRSASTGSENGGQTNAGGGTGGAATGGQHTGSGGAATGGQHTGSGGAATGGQHTGSGGAATGGQHTGSGGAATGGQHTGSGGAATGGRHTGSGGAATGGQYTAGAGGVPSGGDAGASPGGAPSGGHGGGSAGDPGTCPADPCPAPNAGVTIQCKKRFMYGVNYAWSSFGADFGGIPEWNQTGVAANKTARTADLTDMKNNGVDVLRWWMFPHLGGDGVRLDSGGTPTGLGDTVVDDIGAALEIAASLDIHVKLTLFSFDSFWADFTDSGVAFPSLTPIVTDEAKRAALVAKVVVPIARAVESSSYRDHMIAWDVVNEPEWAISGSDPYGDPAFEPNSSGSGGKTMSPVPYAQMETFVKEVVSALHDESSAPVTVGSAAVKWAKAWSKVGLDFYDFHWYGWVDQYYPHTTTPAGYGVADKPVVVGEFPLVPASDSSGQSFGGMSYGDLVDDWFEAGYAGVQGWAFSESNGAFSWSNAKANVQAWASAHTCYTHY